MHRNCLENIYRNSLHRFGRHREGTRPGHGFHQHSAGGVQCDRGNLEVQRQRCIIVCHESEGEEGGKISNTGKAG